MGLYNEHCRVHCFKRANTNPPYWSSHFKKDSVTFKTSKDYYHLICSCVHTLRVKISTAVLVGILVSDCLFIAFFTQTVPFFPVPTSVWKQLSKILTSTLNPSFELVFVAMIETTCQWLASWCDHCLLHWLQLSYCYFSVSSPSVLSTCCLSFQT